MRLKINNRLGKLRQRLSEKEIEAILISQPENRYYLSGFDGSAGFLLITPQHELLATDFRYLEQVKRQAPEFEIFETTGDIENWLPELIDGLNLKKLGFEANNVSFALYHRLSDMLNNIESRLRLIPLDEIVESLRAVKEPEEIEFITEAVSISDAALEHVVDTIQAGITEKEIAWEIEKFLHDNGSQSIPFSFIVASGPNSALPHAQPSERKVQHREQVLIDIGAKFQGYVSDLSRTICLGKVDDTFKKVYDIVVKAQQTAIDGITDGMSGKQADLLAREVIEKAGYGKAFGHSLGHGLGLAPHEKPYLSHGSQDRLDDGMVFTIEPGIYILGWGGVRIEDTVVLENGRIRILSKAKK